MITGTTQYEDVPLSHCKICGGYYKADEPEEHECSSSAAQEQK